uniref:G_PROTEIN_RECEP_F3_4 domain-containing protein n=1 Tax=Ascaris lumbricoides TaxID=6252 RepID=A0A0M3I6P5_ASCLU
MFFRWFVRCPLSCSHENSVNCCSQDPASIDVYTVDNNYTMTSCTIGASSLSQSGITDITAIHNCNGAHFRQLYGKITECPVIRTSHFGVYMAALCIEVIVFLACIVYAIIEVCLGEQSAACALASLGILIIIASFPSFLSLLAGSAPLILFSVATHLLSSLLLMTLSVEAYTLWNLLKFSIAIRGLLPVVITAFVAGSSLIYYFKWISEKGKPALIVNQAVNTNKSNSSTEFEDSTSTIRQKYCPHCENTEGLLDEHDNGRDENNENDCMSDVPYFETAAMSLSSLRSYPYDEEDLRALGGQETRGAHFRGSFTDFKSFSRDIDEEIAPYERLRPERALTPDSVYCDNSFVGSATPQSVYCIAGPSRVTCDGHDSFTKVARYDGEVGNIENASRKKLVYFASLQLWKSQLPRGSNECDNTVNHHKTTAEDYSQRTDSPNAENQDLIKSSPCRQL